MSRVSRSMSARSFLRELRRRKVYRAAAAYAAAAFVVWQVADIAFPSFGLSERAVGVVLVLTLLGFPVAVMLAWVYELRPESPYNVPPQPDSPEVDPPHPNSVAILPFDSLSPGREDEYFADGVAEEITNVLAGLEELHVAARTSAFSFKGRHADIREIGRALNVAYLVEGSVRRAGEALRITAQLLDTNSGFHLWSDRFDRTPGDVFAIQDEIAAAVADRLTRHVGTSPDHAPSAAERPVPSPTPRQVARSDVLTAYDAYLKGRHLMAGFDADSVVDAAAHFEESSELDPSFAAARASLAEALTLQSIGFQVRPAKETMPRALAEAEQALRLDPGLPEAHLARALVAMFYEWNYRAARASFDRAETLGPSVARVQMWREFYFTYVEHDFDAAIEANRRAIALNPVDPSPRMREATVRYLFGHLDTAEAAFRSMLAETPEVSLLHTGLADTLTRLGRIDEAVAEMERAVETGGPLVAWLGILGGLYGLQGSIQKARDVIRELEERSEQGYVSQFWIAVARAGGGDLDAAFAALDEALANRDSNLLYSFFVPRAMGLHDDPRFPAVLRSVNLSHLVPLI